MQLRQVAGRYTSDARRLNMAKESGGLMQGNWSFKQYNRTR